MKLVGEEDLIKFYKGADNDMSARISRAVSLIEEVSAPRSLLSRFDFDGERIGSVLLSGNDVKRHLKGCSEVYVGVCTLGIGVDRLLEKLNVTDLSIAYLADIAASIAVENLTEERWRELKRKGEERGLECTTRYSCGYGDFDLSQQADILRVSGGDRNLGITVNDGGMMYPTKSVTFLCGYKEKKNGI